MPMSSVTIKTMSRAVRTRKIEELLREKLGTTGTCVSSKGWKKGPHPTDCYQPGWITLSKLMISQVKRCNCFFFK